MLKAFGILIDLEIPETCDYCSLLVIKMLPPFPQWCHFSPTSKGDSERGKGRMSVERAWGGTWQS